MARTPKPWYRKDRRSWYVTINGKRHNLGGNKKAAERLFHKLMTEPQPRRPNEPKTAPAEYVIGLIQRFMADLRANAAPDTIEWYRHRLQLFIDYLSDHDLHELTVQQLRRGLVKEWYNSYSHLSSGSKRNLARAIQRVMSWATNDAELIDHNPLAGMKKPRGGKRERVISDAEWQDILSLVPDDDFRDLLRVTWEIGCRPQESLIVEARHVDLVNTRWVFPVSESKTDLPRVIYLTDQAMEITRRRMLRFPNGPLFRNAAGAAWTTDAVNCAFVRIQIRMGQRLIRRQQLTIDGKEITKMTRTLKPTRRDGRQKSEQNLLEEAKRKLTFKKATELAPKFCLYNIRHTWMNRLLTKGVDSLTVAVLAGHCDPSTLAKTYQHLSQNPQFLLEQARRATA